MGKQCVVKASKITHDGRECQKPAPQYTEEIWWSIADWLAGLGDEPLAGEGKITDAFISSVPWLAGWPNLKIKYCLIFLSISSLAIVLHLVTPT